MNIVHMLMELLSGSNLNKLSSLLGESESKTQSAASAAVPAILSGLSNLVSTSGGAQSLANALSKVDAGSLGNLGNLLTGNAGAASDQGGSLLSSLLGGNSLTAIINALTKFSGLGGDKARSLLGYLTPLILGAIAKQFAGKSISPQGLSSFFADQNSNIADAMPRGFSLGDIPGTANAGPRKSTSYDTSKPDYSSASREPASGLPSWLFPLLGLAALALLAFLFWPTPTPPVPEVVHRDVVPSVGAQPKIPTVDTASVTQELTGSLSSMITGLAGIKDAASAQAAIPKLTDLSAKLGSMKTLVDGYSEAAKAKVADVVMSSVAALGDQFNRVLMIPDVGDNLRPTLEGIVNKLTSLGGLAPSLLSLPSLEATKLGSRLSSAFTSLTETLTGIKDSAAARAALPKLQEIDSQLDATKVAFDKLSGDSRRTVASMVQSALAKLKVLAGQVLSIAGVGDSLKPAVDAILTKLAAYTV